MATIAQILQVSVKLYTAQNPPKTAGPDAAAAHPNLSPLPICGTK